MHGEPAIDAIRMALKAIAEEAEHRQLSRILVDALQLPPPEDSYTRFQVGLAIAELLPHPLRTAALYPREFTTYFAETTAYNRGAVFRIFSERNSAMEWLLNDS